MKTSVPSQSMAEQIEAARASEYQTVLVCMIDDVTYEVTEGQGTWSASASFLERTYKVYFGDRRVLEHVWGLARNLAKRDRESCKARIVAFRGFCLPPGACGKQAFYAQELAAW